MVDFAHISNLFLTKNDRLLTKVRLVQEKKLLNLGFCTANETNDPAKIIFNFSSYTLSQNEKTLLAKGLNLAIPPKKLNYGDFLLPFESLFKELSESLKSDYSCDAMDPVAASMKDAALNCFYSYDPKTEQNLSENEYNALKSLMKQENIVVQKSDKGNCVVILNKTDYVERMNELLQDQSKFRTLRMSNGSDYNYIINQEIRISNVLRKLKNNGSMTESTYQRLNPTGSQPSVLYGLAKVHKPTVNNIPKLRPILSAINSPTYKLSKYLNSLLKPFTTNEHTVKDSFAFAAEIQTQQTSNYMASLDVDSLFTNIPLSETINICCNVLFRGKPLVDGLTQSEFRQLLTLATTESLILFNGNYYQQIDGVAMGSPLGPTLANIFLGQNEVKWLNDCPSSCKPLYYRRYVDDLFLLFRGPECVDIFKNYMNSKHSNINFSSESEIEDSIPFLDVFITRINEHFTTSIYRKPTFSGVYTNYDSFLPSIYKSGLISTLLFRAYTICSNWSLIDREIKNIKSFMLKNGYPELMIDKVATLFLNKLHAKNGKTVSDKPEFKIILPYLGSYSKQLERKIMFSLRKFLPSIKVIFIYRAATRLRNLFTFKDRIPSYLSSGIVYKYTCSRCNSTYIGETIRHAKKRFCEHMGTSALTSKPLKGQNPTAVTDHIKKCKCIASLSDFEIIGRDSISENNLEIKESLFVHRDKPVINTRTRSIPLFLFKD